MVVESPNGVGESQIVESFQDLKHETFLREMDEDAR